MLSNTCLAKTGNALCWSRSSNFQKGSLTIKFKFGLLSEALDMNYSAQDSQQSGFWWCCQYLTSTIPTRKPCQDMQSLEINQRFLFGLKVVLISVAVAPSASWLRRMPNPTYCTSQDIPQKADLQIFFFNELFCLECQVEASWTREVSLHTKLRRDVGCQCCPWWSLMP